MSRFLAVALLVGASPTFASPEADADAAAAEPEAEAPPEAQGDEDRHLQVSASGFGEVLGRSLGAEVAASYSLKRMLDVGLGLDIGSSPGILLTARLHLPYEADRPVRPFGQLRIALHPATSGYGAGLFAGVLVELGPGRVQLGAAGLLYLPSDGHLPGALMGLVGYELDVLGTRKHEPKPAAVETPPDTVPLVPSVKKLDTPKPVISLHGKVKDLDDIPVTATIKVTGGALLRPETAAGSEFNFALAAGSYLVIAQADGYLARGVPAQVAQGEKREVELALRHEPTKRSAVLTKESVKVSPQVQFEPKTARIQPASFYLLDEVVDLLLRNPRLRQVRIEGHTDSTGGATFAQNLSEERAMAVMQYLIERGVDASRLRGEGFGFTRPVADNRSEDGRAKNRRVLFEIVEVGD